MICSKGHGADIQAAAKLNPDRVVLADWQVGRGDFARKIELGYRETTQPWIFQGATDITFGEHWDEHALRCAQLTGAKVVGTNDKANPLVKRGRHSTHTLIARDYIDDLGASWDGPGTVFSTAYDHQYVDNELLELAKYRGVWTFCKNAVVPHHHPFYEHTVAMDDTYARGLGAAREDFRLFKRRRDEWQRSLR